MEKIRIRYIQKPVDDDLKHKMVFIGGPRQVVPEESVERGPGIQQLG